MKTLRIYDTHNGVVACNLSRLITLLAPRSIEAEWTISPVPTANDHIDWFDVIGDASEELDFLACSRARVSGRKLAALAEKAQQIIWGQFSGSLPGLQQDAWVMIRAIDSTFYEVTTTDDAVLLAIRSAFDDVQPADGPWMSQPPAVI